MPTDLALVLVDSAQSTVEVLPSAARTATINGADLSNRDARGVQVIVDVTAIVTAPSITVKIQGKDPVSGKYYDLLTSVAILIVSTTILKAYPGITVTVNLAVSDALPATWRVRVEHLNANSITYSVGANLIP